MDFRFYVGAMSFLLSSVLALRIDRTLVESRTKTVINSRRRDDRNRCEHGICISSDGTSSSIATDSLPSSTSGTSHSAISSKTTEHSSSSTSVSPSPSGASLRGFGSPLSSIFEPLPLPPGIGTLTTRDSSVASSGARSTYTSIPLSSSTQSMKTTLQSTPTSSSTVENHHKRSDIPTIVGCILGGIIIITLAATSIICWKRKARKRQRPTVGSFAIDPFVEPHRDIVPVPVLPMEALDSAINLGEQAGRIPSQKSKRLLEMANLRSRTAPGAQVAEALEEINQQTQPAVDDRHGDRVESVENGAGNQSDLNFVTFQHLDSRVRVVELPPMYSSLQDE